MSEALDMMEAVIVVHEGSTTATDVRDPRTRARLGSTRHSNRAKALKLATGLARSWGFERWTFEDGK